MTNKLQIVTLSCISCLNEVNEKIFLSFFNPIFIGMSFSTFNNLPANYGSADGWIYKANPTYSLSVGQAASPTLLKLFPNPAVDFTKVSGIAAGTSVNICTPGGQVIAIEQAGEEGIINTSKLNRGIYFIKAMTSSGNFICGKLIKQ